MIERILNAPVTTPCDGHVWIMWVFEVIGVGGVSHLMTMPERIWVN